MSYEAKFYTAFGAFCVIAIAIIIMCISAIATPDRWTYDCEKGESTLHSLMWPFGEHSTSTSPMLLKEYRLHCEGK